MKRRLENTVTKMAASVLAIILTLQMIVPVLAFENQDQNSDSTIYNSAILTNNPEFDDGFNTQINSSESEAIIAEMGYDFYINHKNSIYQIQNLYNQLPMNRLGQVVYPEYFGGLYINDDGNLVLVLVDNPRQSGVIARLSAEVITKTAEFSFREIMALYGYITYLFMNHYDRSVISNIGSTWTDIVNNNIVISLFDYTQEMIQTFREEVLDSPIIVFEEFVNDDEELLSPNSGEEYLNPIESSYLPINSRNNITIIPGDRIYIARHRGSFCSAGFRAARMGRAGFHCGDAPVGTRIFNAAGREIGTIRGRFLQNIDAAFVEINSNVSVSGVIPPNTYINPQAATPTVGQFVTARGTINGSRGGRIAQINSNATVGNIRFTNTIIANFRSDLGDSGGIAISNVSGRVHSVQGIVVTRIGNTQSRISRTS